MSGQESPFSVSIYLSLAGVLTVNTEDLGCPLLFDVHFALFTLVNVCQSLLKKYIEYLWTDSTSTPPAVNDVTVNTRNVCIREANTCFLKSFEEFFFKPDFIRTKVPQIVWTLLITPNIP